jgi:hypothetical protein
MTTQDQRLARPAGTGTSGMDGGLTLLASARTRLHGVTRRHDEAGLHLQWVHALWWRHNGEEKVGTPGSSAREENGIRGFFFRAREASCSGGVGLVGKRARQPPTSRSSRRDDESVRLLMLLLAEPEDGI